MPILIVISLKLFHQVITTSLQIIFIVKSVLHTPNTEQVSRIQNQSTECPKCCHLAAEMAEMMQKVDGLSMTRKYMHAETLALLTKPLYFPNMKYLK